MMHYVYLIKLPDDKIYIGYSGNLRERVRKHQKEKHIKGLIYYEAYQDKSEAVAREKQLKKYKSAWGHLKRRVGKSYGSV